MTENRFYVEFYTRRDRKFTYGTSFEHETTTSNSLLEVAHIAKTLAEETYRELRAQETSHDVDERKVRNRIRGIYCSRVKQGENGLWHDLGSLLEIAERKEHK